ncbi:MAG: DNA replication/repair protein RecF [Rhodospirillales bacterium]|nr:DNA replication/repair protein RecF [Rhodospirillales bacterium]
MNRLSPVRPVETSPAPARAGGLRTAVTRLTLNDFRCYARLRLEVEAAPVVLTGPNGAGKTNLLEALSFLSPGRGLRRARLAEIDRRSPDGAAAGPWTAAAVLDSPSGRATIGIGRTGDGENGGDRRILRIDGVAVRGQKELGERLSVVWLTPDMDRLFMDGSSARRRFLDRLVYGFDSEHVGRVAAYEYALRERARLLAEGIDDPAWLAALEDSMARHGVAVAAARIATVARLDRAAGAGVGPFPSVHLTLKGEVEGWLAGSPALAVEDRMRAALAASRAHDMAQGGAATGPHRADLLAVYAARGVPAAQCSTGEQKALLLSVLLALARELAAERGAPPLLLLDEVVAHLDGARRMALFDEISALRAQAWLTGTDDELFAGLAGRARFFKVLDATVTPR